MQKTDICGNQIFTWLPYWMSKIERKKTIFTNFCHILALKYQSNCQSILNICSLYKSATMMKQIKTKYHKHLLKNSCTATCRSLPWYFKDWKICHLWMAKILGEQYFFFFFFFFFFFLYLFFFFFEVFREVSCILS